MKCAVLILPSITDRTEIDDVRSKYDPLSGKIPPHITLVFPFDYDEETNLLISHVQRVASTCHRFDLTFGAAESHDPYIWLPVVQGRESVELLHDRLYTDLLRPHLSTRHRYIPHLTIACVAQEIDATLAATQKIKEGTRGQADEMIIERILADDTSETIIRIPLK